MCVSVCVCVCACVRACVRVCVRVCVTVEFKMVLGYQSKLIISKDSVYSRMAILGGKQANLEGDMFNVFT